jgi:hypothetical protein
VWLNGANALGLNLSLHLRNVNFLNSFSRFDVFWATSLHALPAKKGLKEA